MLLAKLMLISTHVSSQNRDTENIWKMRLVKDSKNLSLKLAKCNRWLYGDFWKACIVHLSNILNITFVITVIYVIHSIIYLIIFTSKYPILANFSAPPNVTGLLYMFAVTNTFSSRLALASFSHSTKIVFLLSTLNNNSIGCPLKFYH